MEEGEVGDDGLEEDTQDGSGSSCGHQKTRGTPGRVGTVTNDQRIPRKWFSLKSFNSSSIK